MESLKQIKALVENPYFGAYKWNISVEQLESITNIFSKINKKFLGIYNYNKTYNIGDYVFINNDLFELSNNSSEHFKQLDIQKEKEFEVKIISLKNKKLVSLDGTILKPTYDFNLIKTNHYINETVCIDGKNAYIYSSNKDLIVPLNVSINEEIKSVCLDEVSIYLVLERSIIEKSKTLDNINHEVIFTSIYIIRDISCNNDYVYALLSNNQIAKINRKDKTVEYLETGKFFTDKAKISIVGKKNLFIVDNLVLYCYEVDNTLNLKSEIEHNINKQIIQLEYFNNYLFLINKDNSVYYCHNTLFQTIRCDLRNILDNDKLIIEDIDSYINPKENIIDTENIYLSNKEIINIIKNKGIEINKNKLIYNLRNDFIDKTIYIESEGKNENYTFNNGKFSFTYSITDEGKKHIFLDILKDKVNVYSIVNNNIKKQIIYQLPSLTRKSIELFCKNIDTFIVKKIVIFNNIIDKSKKDRIIDNVLYLPKVNNYTNNLPYSIVCNDIFGTPILKLANKSLVLTNNGVKVNSSEDFSTAINTDDSEKLLSIKGAKNLLSNFTNIVTNFNNEKANKIHRHDFTDLDKVPYADTEKQGLVILSNDITDNSNNKASTPFFVNSIRRVIDTRITNLENTTIKTNTTNIGNILNTIVPNINDNISKLNQNIINGIKTLNDRISAPTSYLDKNIGGEIKGDVSIRTIGIGDNTIRFNKDSNKHSYIFFNRGFINHGPGDQGLEVFRFAPTSYSNQSTGGIEIGYASGSSFNRTSYISSSGFGVFSGSNVTGDLIVGRNITLYGDLVVTSDRRLKTNIKKVENGLKLINQLNGYTFKKIDTGLDSAGVIAQEVEKVMPELILEEDNKLKVNYNGLHSIEIEAIKELSKQIELLREEIKELKRG